MRSRAKARQSPLLYFAQKADVEGYNDTAAVFRSTAEGETGTRTASGISGSRGDPATGKPIGKTTDTSRSHSCETHEYNGYVPVHGPRRARRRLRGNREWFETLARPKNPCRRFQKALDELKKAS